MLGEVLARLQVIIPGFIAWKVAVGQAVRTHGPCNSSAQLEPGGLPAKPPPLLPALEKTLVLLPAPQLVPCHGNPFGSAFGFSWKSLRFWVDPGVGWERFGMLLAVQLEW